MKLVKGETLSEAIQRHHAQNIVLGEPGEVIVLDWRLEKVIGEPDDDAAPIALSPDAQADRTRDGATLATRSARSENDSERTTTSGERLAVGEISANAVWRDDD